MNANQAWQATLGQLQMEMPKASYDTWVSGTKFITHEDNIFRVGVQNAYVRDWLETRLTSTITRLLSGIMNTPQNVQFVLQSREETSIGNDYFDAIPQISSSFTKDLQDKSPLNMRYTFDDFVVGPNNRLAHAASMAVAENPARAYNPLFLYGGVGLGKTHLLQAIGNMTWEKDLNVLYVSSEEFTNDLINSIRSHNTESFRQRYRNIDVLLVDDIQFIAGKESTQEEFFHTFNTLHSQNKQIVISSDRPPKALVTLEKRLRSRFEWGLTADIQPPELETRIAILRSKADRAGRDVSIGILESIARQIHSNIRELEGALTRVLAYSDLSGKPLTSELTSIALVDFMPNNEQVEPDQIVSTVAKAFGITEEQLFGRGRTRKIALPRQIAMYLMREEANASLPQIGETLGGRDHTTVMYACAKVADLIERDDLLRRQVFQIRDQLYNHQVAA
ncbi:MAG TPA: chromosomal replication initiator protein DnaA [Anaerolineae bacterium]|nr:chromosomal replication initiator protein DnaA [Anaerolineae bacterium]